MVSIPPVHGNAPFFQSAVSLPLDRRTQLRKQVALQLQQDLRPEPASRPLRWRRIFLNSIRTPIRELTMPDDSYERRAVRPNELFLVVDFASAAKVRDEYFAVPMASRAQSTGLSDR